MSLRHGRCVDLKRHLQQYSSVSDFKEKLTLITVPVMKTDYFCLISEMLAIVDKNLTAATSNKSLYFRVSGYVPMVNSPQLTYTACLACKRKMIELPNNMFQCESCVRTVNEGESTYAFSALLMDCSGSVYVSVYGNEIGEIITG